MAASVQLTQRYAQEALRTVQDRATFDIIQGHAPLRENNLTKLNFLSFFVKLLHAHPADIKAMVQSYKAAKAELKETMFVHKSFQQDVLTTLKHTNYFHAFDYHGRHVPTSDTEHTVVAENIQPQKWFDLHNAHVRADEQMYNIEGAIADIHQDTNRLLDTYRIRRDVRENYFGVKQALETARGGQNKPAEHLSNWRIHVHTPDQAEHIATERSYAFLDKAGGTPDELRVFIPRN